MNTHFNHLQGLVGHLRSTFKPMFELYLVMKSHSGQPPTADEIMYASGQKPFDSAAHALYINKLEEHTTSIKDAFAKQIAAAAVSFRLMLALPGRIPITILNLVVLAALGSNKIRATLYQMDSHL